MCARLHQARHLKAGFEGLARPWRLSKSATEPCAKRRDRLRSVRSFAENHAQNRPCAEEIAWGLGRQRDRLLLAHRGI